MIRRSCPWSSSWSARLVLVWAMVAIGCNKPQEQFAAPPPRVTVGHPIKRELLDGADFNGWLRASETVATPIELEVNGMNEQRQTQI